MTERHYNRYMIEKVNGAPTDPGADYFVLRLDTDPAAQDAVRRYTELIAPVDAELAASIKARLAKYGDRRLQNAKAVLKAAIGRDRLGLTDDELRAVLQELLMEVGGDRQ